MTVTFTDLQKKHFGDVTASERGAPLLDSLTGGGRLRNLLKLSLEMFFKSFVFGIVLVFFLDKCILISLLSHINKVSVHVQLHPVVY
jgi:hypothetical protein